MRIKNAGSLRIEIFDSAFIFARTSILFMNSMNKSGVDSDGSALSFSKVISTV